MANPIGDLVIALGIDPGDALAAVGGVVSGIEQMGSQASSAMDEVSKTAQDSAQKAAESMEDLGEEAKSAGQEGKEAALKFIQGFNPLKKVIADVKSQLMGAMGAMGAFFAVRQTFSNFLNEADALGKLSQQTRMSIEDLDAWGKANEAAGGSAQALKETLKGFSERTGLSGNALIKMAKTVEGMSERTAKAYLKTMGVAEDAMPIFLKGSKEAQALLAKYRKTAFTQEDAKQARSFKVAWSDFGIAAKSAGSELIRLVLPAFTSVVKFIEKMTISLRENTTFWATLAVAMSAIYAPKMIGGLKKTIATIQALSKATMMAGGIFTLVAAAIIAVGLAIDELVTFADGGDSALEDFMRSSGATSEEIEGLRNSAQTLVNAFRDLWTSVKPLLGSVLVNIFKPVINVVATVIVTLAKWLAMIPQIPAKLKAAFRSMSEAWDAFKEEVSQIPDQIVQKFLGVKDGIKTAVSTWWNEFVEGFLNKIPSITGAFKKVSSWFSWGGDEDKPQPAQQQLSGAVANQRTTQNTTNNQDITINAHIEGVKDSEDVVRGLNGVAKNAGRSIGTLSSMQSGTVLAGGTD